MAIGKNKVCALANGFTLVELLIVLVISSLLLTAVYNVFQSNSKIYIKQNELVKIEENIRSAIYIMVQKIRMAGYNSNYAINSTSDNTKIIYGRNGTNYQFELYDSSMSQSVGNTDIGFKEVGKNNNLIAFNINNLFFNYCNSTKCDVSAKNVSNIQHVQISVTSFSNKSQLDIADLGMNRTVYIRNACLED